MLWSFWGILGTGVQHLPFALVCALANVIAHAIITLHRGGRQKIERELARMFPAMAVQKVRIVAKKTMRNWCLSELENMLLAKWSRSERYREMRILGREKLDAALERGSGVVLLIAHFGAHLQVLPALGFNGYAVNQVTNRRPIDGPFPPGVAPPGYFESWYYEVQERRHGSSLPVRMIKTGGFMRPLFERLALNEIVVMAVDGRDEGRLTAYPFLGGDTCLFSNGPIRLALKAGAAVLPLFIVRGADMQNTLVIEDEIGLDRVRSADEEAYDKTGFFVGLLEQYLREYPDHCGMEFFNVRKHRSVQVSKGM